MSRFTAEQHEVIRAWNEYLGWLEVTETRGGFGDVQDMGDIYGYLEENEIEAELHDEEGNPFKPELLKAAAVKSCLVALDWGRYLLHRHHRVGMGCTAKHGGVVLSEEEQGFIIGSMTEILISKAPIQPAEEFKTWAFKRIKGELEDSEIEINGEDK